MDLTQYVEALRHQLLVAAEAGGEDAQRLAERLMAPLDSATQLVLLDVLSAAASEITRDLAPGSVEVRLRGRQPDFVVTSPPVDDAFSEAAPTEADVAPSAAREGADDGGTARITLRLPEHLKTRVEEAAGRDGLSVNTWLVRAVTDAVAPADRPRATARRSGPSGGDRFRGWAR